MIESGRRSRHGHDWPWMLTLLSATLLSVSALAEFAVSGTAEAWLRDWGFVPEDVLAVLSQAPSTWLHADLFGLVSALFVHGDWLHLAGNLAYLWVFGITVERSIGAVGLAACFVVLGAGANLFLAWQMGAVATPVIGASGGVSAIIGIYLGLFPVSRMGLWLPLGLYLQFARVPAVLVIGSWFTLQLIYTVFGPESGAVAWWAHVAGFIAGVAVAVVLRPFPALADLTLQDD